MVDRGLEDHRPIVRRKLYELVAERVLEEVSQGRLRPGDTLPTERVLAEQYTVGRSSIREALRMLESGGVIESVGRGTFVAARNRNPLNQSLALLVAMHDGDVGELFEVRKILEVETAALAAERRTEEDMARMRSALEEMRRGMDSRDRYVGADIRFHLAVVAASGNRMASHMMQAIREVMHRAFASIYEIPGSPQRSSEQHAAIFEAVAAGRPDEARDRMREHILRVQREIGETLSRVTGEASRGGSGG